ncbi:16879_t:CDS:2, partial [Funneliformis geosporum]
MPPNLRKISLNNHDFSFKNLKFKKFLRFIKNKNDAFSKNNTNIRKFDSENERIINKGFKALFDPNIETEESKKISSNYQPNNTFSTTPQRNNLICYLCKQPGHIKRNCPNGFNVPSNTQNYQHNQTTGSNVPSPTHPTQSNVNVAP